MKTMMMFGKVIGGRMTALIKKDKGLSGVSTVVRTTPAPQVEETVEYTPMIANMTMQQIFEEGERMRKGVK